MAPRTRIQQPSSGRLREGASLRQCFLGPQQVGLDLGITDSEPAHGGTSVSGQERRSLGTCPSRSNADASTRFL